MNNISINFFYIIFNVIPITILLIKKDRPISVLYLDVSKQLFNFLIVSFLDLYMISISQGSINDNYGKITFRLSDLIITSYLNKLLLYMIDQVLYHKNLPYLVSGNYDKYRKTFSRELLVQFGIWILITISTKLLVYYSLVKPLLHLWIQIPKWTFREMSYTEITIIANCLVPFICNSMQCLIIDKFLKGLGFLENITFTNPTLKDDYDDLNILNEWDDYQGIMDDNHYNRL